MKFFHEVADLLWCYFERVWRLWQEEGLKSAKIAWHHLWTASFAVCCFLVKLLFSYSFMQYNKCFIKFFVGCCRWNSTSICQCSLVVINDGKLSDNIWSETWWDIFRFFKEHSYKAKAWGGHGQDPKAICP